MRICICLATVSACAHFAVTDGVLAQPIVTVRAKSELHWAKCEFPRGGQLCGVLGDEHGEPLPARRIEVRGLGKAGSAALQSFATSDAQGRFAIIQPTASRQAIAVAFAGDGFYDASTLTVPATIHRSPSERDAPGRWYIWILPSALTLAAIGWLSRPRKPQRASTALLHHVATTTNATRAPTTSASRCEEPDLGPSTTIQAERVLRHTLEMLDSPMLEWSVRSNASLVAAAIGRIPAGPTSADARRAAGKLQTMAQTVDRYRYGDTPPTEEELLSLQQQAALVRELAHCR